MQPRPCLPEVAAQRQPPHLRVRAAPALLVSPEYVELTDTNNTTRWLQKRQLVEHEMARVRRMREEQGAQAAGLQEAAAIHGYAHGDRRSPGHGVLPGTADAFPALRPEHPAPAALPHMAPMGAAGGIVVQQLQPPQQAAGQAELGYVNARPEPRPASHAVMQHHLCVSASVRVRA